ncbi:ectonucleotide pyrophosphatase/phosphodiesterase family member 5-like isoform X2 [Ornithodoros turicata]
MYEPKLNETFNIANAETKWWDNGQVVPIWSANEMHNSSRHSGAVMWPGSDVKIHGDTSDHLVSYDPNVSFVSRVDTVISWFLHPHSPANCIFLYYEEPDATGHNFGPFSPEVQKMVESVDTLIGHMVEKLKAAGIFDRLNLVILSDHGMAEVPGKNAINLDGILDPKMYFQTGTSPVWNILPAKGKEEFVYNRLKAAANGSHFSVYRAKDVPTRYHYSRNSRILSVVVVADEGWELTTTSTAYMSENHTYGNHGYDNELDSMHPLFIAHGPDFKAGYVSEPFNNVDLYPLMCYLLEIPVLPSNGSLDRVIFLLRRGAPAEHDDVNLWLVCVTATLVLISVSLLVAIICVSRRAKRLRRSMLEGTFTLAARGDTLRRGSTDEDRCLLVDESAS